jgi:hypothetical protein
MGEQPFLGEVASALLSPATISTSFPCPFLLAPARAVGNAPAMPQTSQRCPLEGQNRLVPRGEVGQRGERQRPPLAIDLVPPQPVVLVVGHLQARRQRMRQARLRVLRQLREQPGAAVEPRGRESSPTAWGLRQKKLAPELANSRLER